MAKRTTLFPVSNMPILRTPQKARLLTKVSTSNLPFIVKPWKVKLTNHDNQPELRRQGKLDVR